MKHFPVFKTLGVAALVAMLAPTAAMAQIQTYYRAGVWDAFSGRNDKGVAICGVGNTNTADNRRMSIRFEIGGSDTVLSVSKPDWSIPDGTQVAVVMQVGLNTPWTLQGNGQGSSISWVLDPGAMQTFDRQFRGASSMTLTFPDGNEPPWSVPLVGSSMISDTLGRCIRDLTRQVQAAQAAGAAPAAPAAPVAPQGATQPFNPSAAPSGTATPPAADTPAAPATPAAPTPPAAGGTQPNATHQ
jgi:hypothetical protein